MTKTTLIRLFSLFPDSGADSRSAPRIGLQRLLGLRMLVAGSSVTGALLFNVFSPLELPWIPVALVLTGVVLSVLIGYWRVTHSCRAYPSWRTGHAIGAGLCVCDYCAYVHGRFQQPAHFVSVGAAGRWSHLTA
jgi:hypothetical protein